MVGGLSSLLVFWGYQALCLENATVIGIEPRLPSCKACNPAIELPLQPWKCVSDLVKVNSIGQVKVNLYWWQLLTDIGQWWLKQLHYTKIPGTFKWFKSGNSIWYSSCDWSYHLIIYVNLDYTLNSSVFLQGSDRRIGHLHSCNFQSDDVGINHCRLWGL